MIDSARAQAQRYITIGLVAALLAVVVGAFGAHALHSLLLENGRVQTFSTANDYHFYHAFGLILVGILHAQFEPGSLLLWAGKLMLLGMIIFSGSLYILSISNVASLGAVTPLGGALLVAAWSLCVMALVKQ